MHRKKLIDRTWKLRAHTSRRKGIRRWRYPLSTVFICTVHLSRSRCEDVHLSNNMCAGDTDYVFVKLKVKVRGYLQKQTWVLSFVASRNNINDVGWEKNIIYSNSRNCIAFLNWSTKKSTLVLKWKVRVMGNWKRKVSNWRVMKCSVVGLVCLSCRLVLQC